MSHYDYRCTNCEFEFELNVPIAERDNAVQAPCPDCQFAAVERQQAAPGFADPYRLGRVKKPEGFKEVLRTIKKNHLGSTIDV